MTNHNFFTALQAAAPPAAPFLSPPDGVSRTYGEINALSARLANALVAEGARPGDRIAVQVEKSAENVALYLAALRAGFVYTPLNTAYTPSEVEYFLGDGEPRLFVCDPARAGSMEDAARRAGVHAVLTLDTRGGGSLLDAAQNAASLADVAPRHDDDLAVILYTSGTTGRSKGAMLTHGNLASNARALHALWGFREGDVLLHALPIFHIHGLFVALHTAMLNGSEVLFLPKFDVAMVKDAMRRATVMMGVPTFYARLLDDPTFGGDDCAGMRLFVTGSAPLTA
ncbi:MAG: AMP-binding protein, partial [Pseudomonadota bacterium]